MRSRNAPQEHTPGVDPRSTPRGNRRNSFHQGTQSHTGKHPEPPRTHNKHQKCTNTAPTKAARRPPEYDQRF
eukprot:1912370-Alexandrium_andersonii.AAC.1